MPLIFEKFFDDDSHILGVWKIEEDVDELLGQLMMKPSELEMLESFKNDTRKIQWLSVRVLIRILLGNPAYPFEILYDEYNKPNLVESKYNVSISHSKNKAAVLLSQRDKLGIDIEHIHPKIERVINKFLSPAEIEAAPKGFEIEYYHVCWCTKEALYKLNGRHGINFIDDIKIKPFSYNERGTLNAEMRINDEWHSMEMNYFRINEYMLVYVAS